MNDLRIRLAATFSPLLLMQVACGEPGQLCRPEDMTKEFLRLAPGVNLQGRWRRKNLDGTETFNELEIGQDNLPQRRGRAVNGEFTVVHATFGCDGFTDYPLAVGQRNQVPIPSVLSPAMMGGGRGNDGDFIELLSVDWYEQMLCLAYVRDKDPRASSQSPRLEKTICFKYLNSEDAIEVRRYSVNGTVPRVPPGPPTSSTIYYRVQPTTETGT